ncbi:hypothetical protein Baya_7845 [Bagarius yarrelli]|uniref:Uncharacterized protein n=1 Tax=Bagarius yarrelli TaxID=175774 RepID=A0A556U309_BAGYA|nr:hypothetical protein Baya_7845 [Bagarius yarrelli]
MCSAEEVTPRPCSAEGVVLCPCSAEIIHNLPRCAARCPLWPRHAPHFPLRPLRAPRFSLWPRPKFQGPILSPIYLHSPLPPPTKAQTPDSRRRGRRGEEYDLASSCHRRRGDYGTQENPRFTNWMGGRIYVRRSALLYQEQYCNSKIVFTAAAIQQQELICDSVCLCSLDIEIGDVELDENVKVTCD